MVLGVGAQYYFNRHFGLRAEYEYFPNLGSASRDRRHRHELLLS